MKTNWIGWGILIVLLFLFAGCYGYSHGFQAGQSREPYHCALPMPGNSGECADALCAYYPDSIGCLRAKAPVGANLNCPPYATIYDELACSQPEIAATSTWEDVVFGVATSSISTTTTYKFTIPATICDAKNNCFEINSTSSAPRIKTWECRGVIYKSFLTGRLVQDYAPTGSTMRFPVTTTFNVTSAPWNYFDCVEISPAK